MEGMASVISHVGWQTPTRQDLTDDYPKEEWQEQEISKWRTILTHNVKIWWANQLIRQFSMFGTFWYILGSSSMLGPLIVVSFKVLILMGQNANRHWVVNQEIRWRAIYWIYLMVSPVIISYRCGACSAMREIILWKTFFFIARDTLQTLPMERHMRQSAEKNSSAQKMRGLAAQEPLAGIENNNI